MSWTFFKRKPDQLAFGTVLAFRRFELRAARYEQLLPVLAPILEATPGARILDIGSGGGDAKRFVDRIGPGADWTGIEIDPRRVEICRGLGYRDLVTDLDLESAPLPMPDGAFEVVIASHVLEHLESAERALADWYRVLAPGGVLIVGVPMHLTVVSWLATLRYRLFGRRPRAHCHFFSLRSLQRFLGGYPVEAIIGFRVFSARKLLPLEDWEWFYRASIWLGARFPGLTAEVNVTIRKPELAAVESETGPATAVDSGRPC